MERKPFSKHLFQTIKEYRSFPFIFVESGGNYGDFLIYRGAKKIFDLAGIKYRCVDHLEFMSLDVPGDTVVYINGGGAFNDLWAQRPIDDLIKAITSKAKAVILGPTTFTTNGDFLKERFFSKIGHIPDKKIFMFCREKLSYDTLKKIISVPIELLLDHDTALNLCTEDLLKHVPKGKYKLYSIREDKEGLDFEKKDLLAVWTDPITSCASFEDWVGLHAEANKVVTNRLHSSILSTILKKPVTLLPNSYYKNRSVWEYSLKDKGVVWKDKIESSLFMSCFMKSNIYKKFVNSYKVRKMYGLIPEC